MRLAVFRVMLLSLVRDRGALAIAFILPAAVYLIFAGIFAGAAGGDVKVQAALLDLRNDQDSNAFLAAVTAHPAIIAHRDASSLEGIKSLVNDGAADVGIVVLDNGTGFDQLSPERPAPVLVVYDPLREISVKLTEGVLQETYFGEMQAASVAMVINLIEEAFFPFEPEQQEQLQEGLMMLGEEDAPQVQLGGIYDKVRIENVSNLPAGVSYYAGAVAMLFMLLTAVNGALSVLEERESGMFDRVTTGSGGVAAYVQGKLLFLWLEGCLAVTIIFVAAWAVFGVDVPGRFLPWLAVSAAAAFCAAGLALGFISVCRSRKQAQSLGHILVLVLSALGGSMVPRFLMPPAVQELGWLTPNTWVIEAYGAVFWREAPPEALLLPIGLLVATGTFAALLATAIQYRRRGR